MEGETGGGRRKGWWGVRFFSVHSERYFDGQHCTKADQPRTQTDHASFQRDTILINRSNNPWISKAAFLYERPTIETHCCRRKEEEERVWDDVMKNYEGLKGIYRGNFWRMSCIECNDF